MKNNHIGQIIIGIIVTVVGGFILAWLVGEGRFAKDQASAETPNDLPTTALNLNSENELIAQDLEEVEAATSSNESIPPTPWGIKNPSSPVPEGERALIGDYAVWVSGLTLQRDNIWFDVFVENVDTKPHILRFTKSSFNLEDDIGNQYPGYFEDDSRMYQGSQISIEPGEVILIKGNNMFWNDPTSLPHFLGPISSSAGKLIVVIKGDSPFNGVEFELDL